MSTPVTIPVFDPQGVLRDVPQDQLKAAVDAGGKPSVRFQAPDGKIRYVPANMTADAVKAGGKMLPIEQQDVQQPGFWHSLVGDLSGMAKGAASMLSPATPGIGAIPWAANMAIDDMQRKQEGRSPAYRAAAPIVQNLTGANVRGMEESANEGDQAGVLGHAATVPALTVASEALAHGAPLISKGVQKVALIGRTPEEAYQSALKPSTTIPPTKVARVVQTGLREGIPVSPAGLEKISSLIDDVNDKISAEIGAGKGKTIDPTAVAQRADSVKGKFANQVNPTADLQAIADSKQEFLANNKQPISAADAQAMKQGTYKQLSAKAYGELKSASIEAQKALARGLKEELANAFPELNDLNAQDSKLLDLKPILEKAIQREANHQLGGIGTPITAGATKAVTGSNALAGVAGLLKAVVDNPNIKSRLAIALSRKGVSLPVASSRIQAYSAALAASAANNEAPDSRKGEPQQ